MALEDALRLINADWADIEARLSVRELFSLAHVDELVWPRDVSRPEMVFGLISQRLPSDHRVWPVAGVKKYHLSSPAAIRPSIFEEELAESLADECVRRARSAVEDPSILDEATSDLLVEVWLRNVVTQSLAGAAGPYLFDVRPVISAEINGEIFYPVFQFKVEDNRPIGVHEIVGRLDERLGGRGDPLGVIGWWLAPNAWLGRSPSELLGLGRDAEIEYAAEQLENDSW